MKTVIATLTIATLLLSGLAFAGGQPAKEDFIGLYFDEMGEMDCWDADATDLYTMIPVYVILSDLTSDSIGGWEAKIWFDGGVQILTAVPRGQYIDAAVKENEYIVGLGAPLMAVDGMVVIMDMTVLVLGDVDPFYGYAGNVYFHTLEAEVPAYLDGSDPEIVKALNMDVNENEPWLAIGNVSCKVDNEALSFDGLKSLYR